MGMDLGSIASDIRKASEAVNGIPRRVDAIEETNALHAASSNELFRKTQRPGWSTADGDDASERKCPMSTLA